MQCMCVAQIFLSGTGERWESKCVTLTERRGSQSVWTTHTHRLPDTISPSRESCTLNQSIWPAVESRSGTSPFSQAGSAWTHVPAAWRRLQMERITCTLSAPTATDLSMVLLGLKAFAKRNKNKKNGQKTKSRKVENSEWRSVLTLTHYFILQL